MKKNIKRSGTDSGYSSKNYSAQSAQHQPAMVMLPRQHDPGQYHDDYVSLREFEQPAPSGTDSGYSSQSQTVQLQLQLPAVQHLVSYCMPIPPKPTNTEDSFDFTSAHSRLLSDKLSNLQTKTLESSRDKYNSSDFGTPRYGPCCSGGENNRSRENDDYCGHVKVPKEKIMDSDDEGIEDEDEMQNASMCMGMGTRSNSQDVSSLERL